MREQLVHDLAARAQILDGLEERDDVERRLRLQARRHQADLFQQERDLEQIARAGGHRDDVVRDRLGAEAAVDLGDRLQRLQRLGRLLGVVDVRRDQRPRRHQLAQQHPLPLLLGHRLVDVAAGRARHDLAHHARVHAAVLAQIDRRQVEPERAHRAQQVAQPPVGGQAGAVVGQRHRDDFQIELQLHRRAVGPRRADRARERTRRRRAARCQLLLCRREPRVDAGERAPERLVRAALPAVRRARRQLGQLGRDLGVLRRQPELAAERVHLGQVVRHDHRRPGARRRGG